MIHRNRSLTKFPKPPPKDQVSPEIHRHYGNSRGCLNSYAVNPWSYKCLRRLLRSCAQAFEEWEDAKSAGQETLLCSYMGLNNSTMRMVAGMRSQLLAELQVNIKLATYYHSASKPPGPISTRTLSVCLIHVHQIIHELVCIRCYIERRVEGMMQFSETKRCPK